MAALVSIERYRAITGDASTPPVLVTARLEAAIDELEEVLDRPLTEAERTETMAPTRDGYLWPRATPISAAPDGYTIDGLGLRSTWPASSDFLGAPTYPAVTYTGGWTAATVPRCIERDLARAAWVLGRPDGANAAGIDTTGATSLRVGDVAVTYGPRGAPGSDIGARLASVWSLRTLAHRYSVVRGV